MSRRGRSLRHFILIAACVFVGGYLLLSTLAQLHPANSFTYGPANNNTTHSKDPVLTIDGLQHITDGDTRGGGHLYGTGAPCKSEFPANWTRETIARDIPFLAANDNLHWQESRNGYITAESITADGFKVRIVVDPQDNHIVTAYPTNVARNPCPANANRRN